MYIRPPHSQAIAYDMSLIESSVSFIAKASRYDGKDEIPDKVKERERKELKRQYPNRSYKWNNLTKKWQSRDTQKREILDKLDKTLNEISLRTGAVTFYLARVYKWAKTVDSGVSKMKSLASSLENATTDEKRNKIETEFRKIDADVKTSLSKMIMNSALVSAAGGLGADRSYKLLKKLTKKRKR
jgi:hypothetical protein